MARFEVRKLWLREEVLSLKQKWIQILMDEKIKLRVRELLNATRNYPNYIVSVRSEYKHVTSIWDTITKYYYNNYSVAPIFVTSNNPDYMEAAASTYASIELMVTGKWKQMQRSGVISDVTLALNFNPVLDDDTYFIAYFMVKDPSKPAKLIRRYRKIIDGNKYWGDTLIYNWDPSNYVPEAIMSVMRRSNELCSAIPTCALAMSYEPMYNEPFSTVGLDLRIKLEDLSYGIKESWLGVGVGESNSHSVSLK